MSKKNRKKKFNKTLVEEMLDRRKIPCKQLSSNTIQKGDVKQMDTFILDDEEVLVYKTLICEGNKNSPIVGAVPVTEYLSMKKLARVSDNEKYESLPLKKLVATTDYVHGANTPIGIYQEHYLPIYLDSSMKDHDQIAASSGEVGRSIMINPEDLQKVTEATLADLLE